MNKQQKTDAWTLFHSLFKKGEEVWLITDEDDFIWGKLLAFNNEECALLFRGKDVWFRWDGIRFMSHDGFPVRALTGADGSRSILKEQGTILKNIRSGKWIYSEEGKQCPLCKHTEEYCKFEVAGSHVSPPPIKKWIKCGFEEYASGSYGLDVKIGCFHFEPSGKKIRLVQEKEYDGGDYGDNGSISLGRSTSSFGDPFLIEDTKMTILNLGNRGDDFEDHDFEEVIVCEAKDGAMGLLYDLETVYMF